MTDATIRQGVLAYLERLPRSEWGSFWLIGRTIYGEPLGVSPTGRVFDERISDLSDVLERMRVEGVLSRYGHIGWRIAA